MSVFLLCVFAAGVALMLYPSVARLWNTRMQKALISSYETDVSGMAEEDSLLLSYEYEKARAYNQDLWPVPDPEAFVFLKEEDPQPEYLDCLNLRGDELMGYVSIPKIGVEIPIYHGTDEETLTTAAGHLEGTSLPIGGASTHAVIAAHRGLPGAALFTNLDKMEPGDHFFLTVLSETLGYEVDQILVVEPEDVSALVIVDGEDLCTLLTCTPYGVNTQRLLVRGHRVALEPEEVEESTGIGMTMERGLLLIGLAVAAGCIGILRINRKKQIGD